MIALLTPNKRRDFDIDFIEYQVYYWSPSNKSVWQRTDVKVQHATKQQGWLKGTNWQSIKSDDKYDLSLYFLQ